MRLWRRLVVLVSVVVLVGAGAGCGRSSVKKTSGASAATPRAASGDFGTLKAVCGPGSAKGSTDQGVSDTTIAVGTMSDPGNTILPGLDQELFDAATAFAGWCNAAGGILGRHLALHQRDAKLFQVAAQMIASCGADFMLVGNGEGLDATGVTQRVGCKLPEISAYDVSAQAGQAPLSIQAIPTPDDESRLGGPYRALAAADPAATKHYGMLNSNQSSIRDSGLRNRAAAEVLGYVTVEYEELPLAVNNWRPYVENLKSHGVQVLTLQGNPEQVAALYRTMADVGYFPKYTVLDANHYDTKLTDEAGPVLAGQTVLVNSPNPPFEQAARYPAINQYLQILDNYAGGAKPKALGVSALSSWLLFAQAAKACGSNLTRDCVMTHAGAAHHWDAGGLNAPDQPGNSTVGGPACFTLLKATPTGFVLDPALTQPNTGIYNCNPANAFKLKGFPQSS